MPTPGEHKIIQARILEYSEAIGWTRVPLSRQAVAVVRAARERAIVVGKRNRTPTVGSGAAECGDGIGHLPSSAPSASSGFVA